MIRKSSLNGWKLTSFIAIVMVAILAAPDAFANRAQIEEELDTMNQQLARLAKKWNDDQKVVAQQVKRIEDTVLQIQRNQANLILKMDQLMQSLGTTEGRVTENVNTIQAMSNELSSLSNRIDILVRVVGGEEVAAEVAASDPEAVYNMAYEDYLKERYPLAISGFKDFLQRFPQDPRAAEAQFYLGESHFSEGNFRDAIVAFRSLTMDYSNSSKLPDAMLKIGLAQFNLGNNDDAAQIFQDVAASYPNTPYARMAEQRLKTIRGE